MTACADSVRSPPLIQVKLPTAPAWVDDVLGGDAKKSPAFLRGDTIVRATESSDFGFFHLTVPNAGNLDDLSFSRAVERTYLLIAELLRLRRACPLRFWNYVPGMHRRSRGGLRRYEVFNAGRFEAYRAWYQTDHFGNRLAAASAVDHRGDDLTVQLLAGRSPGTPVENPRQTPAYRYSRRYGPLPPSFCRAMLLERCPPSGERVRWVIVAGTASVTGEDTQHPGDLAGQLRETCLNLACLSSVLAGDRVSQPVPRLGTKAVERALARYRELRAYVVRDSDVGEVIACFRGAFPNLVRLEVASVDLCRPELLVEAEGIAFAGTSSGQQSKVPEAQRIRAAGR